MRHRALTHQRRRGHGFARLALLALLALLAGCRPSPAPSGLARVRASGVLRWGGDLQGGAPYVYEDPDRPQRLKGFEVELADALARELGVRARFVQNDWTALVPALERGAFDVVLNGLEVTPARVGRLRFTRPYYSFAARLMARRDDPRVRADLTALQGLRVGTLRSSFSEDLLRGRAEIVGYEGQEEPYLDLAHGRTDAVLLDDIIARRYGESRPGLRVVGDVQEGYYAMALRPADEDLARALDEALGRIMVRGELEAILRRESLWNDRQAPLRAWSAEAQARMLGVASSPRRMTASQAWLFVRGAGVTLKVSSLAMLVAVALGLALALARRYGPRPLAAAAAAYVELYRGTPVFLQLYVIYYGLADVVSLSPVTAAVLGLGMNYAAYEAEVYRAGLLAVPRGQMEAALSLGMSTPLALRRVILPQALRLALPAVTNDFIALLKDSSLVSVITVVELTKRMTITAVDTRSYLLPGLLCAALYFAMSYPLSLLARRLDARLARA